MEEIRYSIKRLDAKRVAVTKLVDSDYVQTYTIEDFNCDCPGCMYHKTQCKHLRVKSCWEASGEPNDMLYEVTKKGQINSYRKVDPNA